MVGQKKLIPSSENNSVVGSPQYEELHKRVAALRRLRTPDLVSKG